MPNTQSTAGASRWPLLVMLSGTFLVVLDFFIVNVALPAIQQEFAASSSTLQWVLAAYGLATAAGLVTGGRLGDVFGRRRMFLLGLLLFTVASLACGLAPSGGALVGARVLQGVAGALLQPQVLAMMSLLYTGAARARAFAAYGLALGLGATLGQLVGGALIQLDLGGLGWRLCFLVNLPIGAAALLLGPRVLPPLAGADGKRRLDLVGVLLVAAAAVATMYPLVEGRAAGWPAWAGWCLALAVALFALFAAHQRRRDAAGRDPLLPLSLFGERRFARGLWTALAFYAGNASLYFVLALYLQQGLRLGPLLSGAVFTALAVGFFVTSMAAPRLAEKFGGAPLARGALLLAAAHALQLVNVALAPGLHALFFGVPLLLAQGAGLGLVMAPLSSALLAGLPPRHSGVAAGVLASVQQAGNALGVALIGVVFYGLLEQGAAFERAFAASLLYLTVSALAAAALWRTAQADARPQVSSLEQS